MALMSMQTIHSREASLVFAPKVGEIPGANSLDALVQQCSPATWSSCSILTSCDSPSNEGPCCQCLLLVVSWPSAPSYFIQRCTGYWHHCVFVAFQWKSNPIAARTFQWASCIIPLSILWEKCHFTYKLEKWALSRLFRAPLVRNVALDAS